jgi:hypothetical protein
MTKAPSLSPASPVNANSSVAGKRMQLTQRAANVHGGSGLLWFVMHIIPIVSLFAPVYLQYQLNQAWETQPAAVFGAPVAAAA